MHEHSSLRNWKLQIPGKGSLSVEGSLSVGECVVLRGPSGCGKSTFLRSLAGLHPSAGEFRLGERRMDSLPPHERDCGFFFQGAPLFEQWSVLDNLLFPLRHKEKFRLYSEDLRKQRATELLNEVGLGALQARLPAELSGGERGRVALLRILISEPRYLLLDEPFSALDPETRRDFGTFLAQRLEKTPCPVLWVTHDEEEAKSRGTRVLTWPTQGSTLTLSPP